MDIQTSVIPAAADVRDALVALSYSQMQELSKRSEVPFTTLWKIRAGETTNPGIETVKKFFPLIDHPKAA